MASSSSRVALSKTATHVLPTYARFPIRLSRGSGRYVWDDERPSFRYLDMAGGIAVSSVGHAHPHVVRAVTSQTEKLMHCSNLYYIDGQEELASRLTSRFSSSSTSPGRVFFCNSGAEADEGLIKLARRAGRDSGRYEIITAIGSFHGRTMGGISATGQEKIKDGFSPLLDGFVHVPFNDLEAAEAAVTERTSAIMIEGIQGEGGIVPASADYLTGLRRLCDEHNLLLMIDAVQCGHFRTGRFQSYERILEDRSVDFRPDAVSMAKSLGGGFPIGAFWVNESHIDALPAGTHGSTFGGGPLACATANAVLDVIEREGLERNAREMGDRLIAGMREIASERVDLIEGVRGLGLMCGLVLRPGAADATAPSLRLVEALHDRGALTVPSGERVVRCLPPLNITASEVDEFLEKLSDATLNMHN